MTKHSHCNEVVEKKKGMLALLAARPYNTQEMADAIGCSTTFVRRRLAELTKAGRVYRERVLTMFGHTYRWHAGSAPDVMPESDEGPAARQVTVRNYPPINRRDPLVTALFGPATTPRVPNSLLELER